MNRPNAKLRALKAALKSDASRKMPTRRATVKAVAAAFDNIHLDVAEMFERSRLKTGDWGSNWRIGPVDELDIDDNIDMVVFMVSARLLSHGVKACALALMPMDAAVTRDPVLRKMIATDAYNVLWRMFRYQKPPPELMLTPDAQKHAEPKPRA